MCSTLFLLTNNNMQKSGYWTQPLCCCTNTQHLRHYTVLIAGNGSSVNTKWSWISHTHTHTHTSPWVYCISRNTYTHAHCGGMCKACVWGMCVRCVCSQLFLCISLARMCWMWARGERAEWRCGRSMPECGRGIPGRSRWLAWAGLLSAERLRWMKDECGYSSVSRVEDEKT